MLFLLGDNVLLFEQFKRWILALGAKMPLEKGSYNYNIWMHIIMGQLKLRELASLLWFDMKILYVLWGFILKVKVFPKFYKIRASWDTKHAGKWGGFRSYRPSGIFQEPFSLKGKCFKIIILELSWWHAQRKSWGKI